MVRPGPRGSAPGDHPPPTGLSPALAGVVLPLCVIAFGASHGAFNVGYGDLLAKTVAQPHRGSLVAYRAALGGGLTLAVSLAVLSCCRRSQATR